MKIRSFLFAAMLVLATGTLPGPADADTVDARPRLAVSLAGTSATSPFGKALQEQLTKSRRFELVDRPKLKDKLATRRIKLTDMITVAESRSARTMADTDLILDAVYQAKGGNVKVTTRLFDLRTGEYSRDLALLGSPGEVSGLAVALADFVRQSVPIRCLVKDVNEDAVILDLGETDGIKPGSTFKAYRYPQNMRPVEVATLRITAVKPFGAIAEVEESIKGFTVQRGDMVLEQTAGMLVGTP
jgi:hypothetical protein